MKLVRFSMAQILAMPRPPGYVEELSKCALERTPNEMVFDIEGDCFNTLKSRYSGYQPTPDERRLATQNSALLQKHRPKRMRSSAGGCGGCKGRKNRG